MATLRAGDKAAMPGVPWVVEVLAVDACGDRGCGDDVIVFADPATGERDRAHASDFVRVG